MEKTVILRFTKKTWNQPVIHGLAQRTGLVFNILEAKVLPRQDSYAIINLEGSDEDYRKGIEYLEGCNILIEEVPDKVQRDEDSCVHCGACTAVCPTDALHMEGPEKKIELDRQKCVACGNCVNACPVQCIDLFIFNGEAVTEHR
jgi:ferredoxin